MEWLLETLHTLQDWVQLVSVSNTLTEMAGFGMVDVALSVHSRIQNLCLQMAWAVFGQMDIGELEWLFAEIPVSPDSLFAGQLTNVIVEQAKWARHCEKFYKEAEHCDLKTV